MARNVNDIIKALPASRRKKIERRGAALVAGEMTDEQGEVRELTAGDFKRAVPFSKLPESLQEKLRSLKTRGPQKTPTKEMISIRLSRDVVERLRASGRGWQARVDAHLRKWVRGDAATGAKSAKRQ